MLAAAVGAVVVGTCAFAMARQGAGLGELSVKEQVSRLVDAGMPAGQVEKAEARLETRLAAQSVREASDVGDPDSFGRNVRWLGYMSGELLSLRQSCALTPGEDPNRLCMEVSPYSMESRYAAFRDVARMTLPARSMNSMLCHWLSPTVVGTMANYSGYDNAQARIAAYPWLTIENEALNDPALIDPETGEPLNGKVEIYASGSVVSANLDVGEALNQRQTASRTCVGGYLSKRALKEVYGLSEAQADEFFRKPTTVRLNMEVFASMVATGNVAFAIRFVGD